MNQDKIDEFLTWVMANRDASARQWSDEVEPKLLSLLQALITEARKETANKAVAIAKIWLEEDGRPKHLILDLKELQNTGEQDD